MRLISDERNRVTLDFSMNTLLNVIENSSISMDNVIRRTIGRLNRKYDQITLDVFVYLFI